MKVIIDEKAIKLLEEEGEKEITLKMDNICG